MPSAGWRAKNEARPSAIPRASCRWSRCEAPGRSTDKEPFAAALGTRLLHDRLAAQTERVRQYIGDDLRPGLSVADAGQRYCALASRELYYVLTVELGWTAEQHRRWLTDLLATELLEPCAPRLRS